MFFSRLDLCYNTGHEFDTEFNREFVRFHGRTEGCSHRDWRSCESRTCKSEGCILDLSQLLLGVARTPLQGGL